MNERQTALRRVRETPVSGGLPRNWDRIMMPREVRVLLGASTRGGDDAVCSGLVLQLRNKPLRFARRAVTAGAPDRGQYRPLS
jgi:hypothetical protein